MKKLILVAGMLILLSSLGYADEEYIINLSTEAVETAQRLCDDGIGSYVEDSSGTAKNLTVLELIQWRINDYLGAKKKMYLREDKKTITDEELEQIIDAREEVIIEEK